MRGSLLSSADSVAPIISSICASKTSSLKERKEEGVAVGETKIHQMTKYGGVE